MRQYPESEVTLLATGQSFDEVKTKRLGKVH